MPSSAPVGVFDSGVGGLTVLHECLVTMPHEDFVYLGDHARLPYGPRTRDEVRRFAHEIGVFLEQQDVKLILVACVDAGGSITGEHGVGTDKACAMPLMFGEVDIETMERVRRAFDPRGLSNPGKLFPTAGGCARDCASSAT